MDKLVEYLASQGAVGVLGAVIFYFYRRDVKSYTTLWKTQSEVLLQVVKENTAAVVLNTEVTRELRNDLHNTSLGVIRKEDLPQLVYDIMNMRKL